MKNKAAIKAKILEEEDFIYCPRLGNSIKSLLEVSDNANGIPDERICKVLLISQEELDTIYQNAIKKLRKKMLEG